MYGAIIGDVVGSKFEFDNIKTKDFPLFSEDSIYTDDTIMTIAVAKALMRSFAEKTDFKQTLIFEMKKYGKKYPYPKGGYGMRFSKWLYGEDSSPYNSLGNGSAMRVSPCGLLAENLDEALSLAQQSSEVTHNHPEGIKGAKAVAGAVFIAKKYHNKQKIADFIKDYYDIDFSIDEIRDSYTFDETCQGTIPQAIVAFLESESFEDAIRNAVSVGGDCDTLTAITGSVAWSYYRPVEGCLYDYPEFYDVCTTVRKLLPGEFLSVIDEFEKFSKERNMCDN